MDEGIRAQEVTLLNWADEAITYSPTCALHATHISNPDQPSSSHVHVTGFGFDKQDDRVRKIRPLCPHSCFPLTLRLSVYVIVVLEYVALVDGSGFLDRH